MPRSLHYVPGPTAQTALPLRTAAEMLKDTTLLPEQKLAMAITVAERLEQHVLRPPRSDAQEQSEDKPDDEVSGGKAGGEA